MLKLKLGAVLLLAFVVFAFIVQNAVIVKVRLFFWSFELSQVVLMLMMLVAGMVISWVLSGYLHVTRQRRNRPPAE